MVYGLFVIIVDEYNGFNIEYFLCFLWYSKFNRIMLVFFF